MNNQISRRNLIKLLGVSEYTKLQADAREEALQRMITDAENLGADAIICIRFQTSVMMAGASELLAYGTAVKTK